MDRLVRYPGGQPVRSQDLEFIQDAFKKSIAGLSKMFGSKFILYGSLDSSKTNVIEGAVVIDGEVYEVPSLGAIGNNNLCFRVSDSDDREFFNGLSHKVRRTYQAYLSTDTGSAAAWIDLKGSARPFEDLKNLINDINNKLPTAHTSKTAKAGSSGSRSFASYTFDNVGETSADVILFHANMTLDNSIQYGFTGCVKGDGQQVFAIPAPDGSTISVNYDATSHLLYFDSVPNKIKAADKALMVVIKKK